MWPVVSGTANLLSDGDLRAVMPMRVVHAQRVAGSVSGLSSRLGSRRMVESAVRSSADECVCQWSAAESGNNSHVTLQSAATAVRALVMLALGALALWFFASGGGEHTFLGVVLTLLVACGFVVGKGRVRWYAVGVACVFTALFLGSVSGPLFDAATTGYCDSVFEPFEPGQVMVDDAPPGTYETCAEVRQERIPVIAVLAVAGLVGLALSLRKRRRASGSA